MEKLENITAFLNSENQLSRNKLDELFEVLYPEVKKIANQQLAKIMKNSEVTPTLLVNECYIKLKNSSNVDLKNRKHFYGLVARCMRFYLIDMVRKHYRSPQKKEGTVFSVTQIAAETTEVDLLVLGDALERLENIDEDLLNIVELRFFGGFSLDEIAEMIDSNKTHIFRQWNLAKSMLANLIDEQQESS